MIIEEGKFYRTADGRKVGPMQTDDKWFRGKGVNLCVNGQRTGNPQRYNADGTVYLPRTGEEQDHLIAEWSDSTGVIRTVTREEIVPGKYGSVIVGHHFTPGWVDIRWRTPGTTVAELRAAAKVLTELADARERGVSFAQDGDK